MTLALDSSTPAVASANAQTVTTASFTPPAGAVLYAIALHGCNNQASNRASTITDSAGLAWTPQVSTPLGPSPAPNGSLVRLWTATVITSAAMTVTSTITANGFNGSTLRVLVYTGADPAAPLDGSAVGGSANAVVSQSITTTVYGTIPWIANADWTPGAAPTAASGTTTDTTLQPNSPSGDQHWIGTASAVGTPGTVTLATSAPTTGNLNAWVMFGVRTLGVPPNDNLANAQTLLSGTSQVTGDNTYASVESGETRATGGGTSAYGAPPGPTVWYRWKAPLSVQTQIDTIGSNLDTYLTIYKANTGVTEPVTAFSDLVAVASDDDNGGSGTSRVIFTPVAGTVYYIQVAGYATGYYGRFVLNYPSPTGQSIFTTQTPHDNDNADGTDNYSLATYFGSTVPGTITHIRWFFPYTAQPGGVAPKANLYRNSDATKVGGADATFPYPGNPAGWNKVALTTPFVIAANTDYSATIWTPSRYVSSTDPNSPWPLSNGYLYTPGNAGRFTNGASGNVDYAANSFNNGCYFVDVVFEPADLGAIGALSITAGLTAGAADARAAAAALTVTATRTAGASTTKPAAAPLTVTATRTAGAAGTKPAAAALTATAGLTAGATTTTGVGPTAAAALAVTAGLTAGAVVTDQGDAGLVVTATLAAGAVVTDQGNAALTVTAGLSAGGVVTDQGDAGLVVTAGLTAGGTVTDQGAATLAVTAGLNAGGIVTDQSDAALVVSAALTAGAVVTDQGDASLAVTATLAAGTVVTKPAAAALTVTATLAAAAASGNGAAAVLPVVVALTAGAAVAKPAAAGVVVTATLAAGAIAGGGGVAVLTVTAGLTAGTSTAKPVAAALVVAAGLAAGALVVDQGAAGLVVTAALSAGATPARMGGAELTITAAAAAAGTVTQPGTAGLTVTVTLAAGMAGFRPAGAALVVLAGLVAAMTVTGPVITYRSGTLTAGTTRPGLTAGVGRRPTYITGSAS